MSGSDDSDIYNNQVTWIGMYANDISDLKQAIPNLPSCPTHFERRARMKTKGSGRRLRVFPGPTP